MSSSETVWIVDDDRSIRWVLEKALQQEGMTTQSFDSADGVLSRLSATAARCNPFRYPHARRQRP